jgi:hypothetical protein
MRCSVRAGWCVQSAGRDQSRPYRRPVGARLIAPATEHRKTLVLHSWPIGRARRGFCQAGRQIAEKRPIGRAIRPPYRYRAIHEIAADQRGARIGFNNWFSVCFSLPTSEDELLDAIGAMRCLSL